MVIGYTTGGNLDKLHQVCVLVGPPVNERTKLIKFGACAHLLVFIEANKQKKAMVAHEKALEWQELFMLMSRSEVSDGDIVETAYRLAGELWVLPPPFPLSGRAELCKVMMTQT